jgi:hypothetical protein
MVAQRWQEWIVVLSMLTEAGCRWHIRPRRVPRRFSLSGFFGRSLTMPHMDRLFGSGSTTFSRLSGSRATCQFARNLFSH